MSKKDSTPNKSRSLTQRQINARRKELTSLGVRRSRLIALFVCVMMVLTMGKLFYIQVLTSEETAAASLAGRTRTTDLAPERGQVTDANGVVLASSVNRYDLTVDQRLVKDYRVWSNEDKKLVDKDIDEQVDKLSKMLDMKKSEIRKLMFGQKPYQIVARNLTPEKKDEVMDLRIPGLIAKRVTERQYPNGNIAGSVLGFVGKDGNPLEGLELSQDKTLKGKDGKRTFEVSADGVRIPNAPVDDVPAVNGNSIRLTLDSDLQWYAQEAASKKAKERDADWASIIVLDAKTGEIKAMADSKTVNPKDPSDTNSAFWRPLSTTHPFEPGSTGKAVTIAAAIEEGLVEPNDSFVVPNQKTLNGQKINDATPHYTHELTASGIFAMSSNTGTVQIGEKMDDKTRYDYMKKFGIGDPIDIGMPYSAPGVLKAPEEWDGRTRLTTMFGQGYSQSMLHTAQIYQTLANDGVRMPPTLIKGYANNDGTYTDAPEKEGIRVVSPETSKKMLRMMEGTVYNGVSKSASIDGYVSGGKSGTAQVVGENGRYDGYAASFAGVYPTDNPRYVIVGAVYRPDGWTGNAVDEMVANVAQYALHKDQVAASGNAPSPYDTYSTDPQIRRY